MPNTGQSPAGDCTVVRELEGHIALWTAVRPAGEGLDPRQRRVTSP